MTFPLKTAKSARRVIALALLGVLATAVAIATTKPAYTVTVSPGSQTVNEGSAAAVNYSITIVRSGKFSDAIELSLAGLPAAAKATAAVDPATVGAGSSTSVLRVQTDVGGVTPAGTYPLTVTGVATKTKETVRSTATLTVVRPEQPNFSIAASPATRTIPQGDSASYALGITRSSLSGPVDLSVSGLPSGATATFSPNPVSGSAATLVVYTTGKTKDGVYPLQIVGSATAGGSRITRSAGISLVIQENKSFSISGGPGKALTPGTVAPLDLLLDNPHNFTIRVTSLNVAIEQQTSRPGCGGVENFKTRPAQSTIVVPAGPPKRLSELGVPQAAWPAIEFLDSAANQNSCKDATLNLQYSGTAVK